MLLLLDPFDFRALSQILSRMTASRAAFVQFFDAFLAERRLAGAEGEWPQSHLDAIAIARLAGQAELASLDPGTGLGAAALALSALPDREAVVEALIAATSSGLFDPPAGDPSHARQDVAAAVSKTLAPLSDARAGLERADLALELATSSDETLPDPDALLPAIQLARKRLCRIETRDGKGKPVVGTGFLIGPSAVLTNWHVVEDVPRPRGNHPLSVRFDFGQTTGSVGASTTIPAADDWCIAHCEEGPLAPAEAGPSWWMDDDKRRAWRAELADRLDYAVVRLDGAPGAQRGCYDLHAAPPDIPNGTCFALHHPGGRPRTLTAGHFKLWDAEAGGRVFHTATTLNGSSGALILDDQARPVALHHLGLGKDAYQGDDAPRVPQDVVNVAIPLRRIADALAPHREEIERLDGLSLPQGCVADGRPAFGRERLIRQLGYLRDGTFRLLWVRPPGEGCEMRKLGKSFTVDIIEALLPPPDNLYVKMSADQIRPDARDMAAAILQSLAPDAADRLPPRETTDDAYARALVNAVRAIFFERWPDKTIWLIIDDLDVHQLPDSAGRAFLDMLYASVRTIPQLRIVLIGLQVKLATIPEELLAEDEIVEVDAITLARQFRDWLQLRGVRNTPIDDAVQVLIADALASFAGREAPLAALSGFTAAHLTPPLERFLRG